MSPGALQISLSLNIDEAISWNSASGGLEGCFSVFLGFFSPGRHSYSNPKPYLSLQTLSCLKAAGVLHLAR